MKKLIITFAIILFISTLSFGKNTNSYHKHKQNEEAQALVKKALKAMGGEEKIRSLKSLNFKGMGHNFAVEQSERPEGPSIVAYQQLDETRDLSKENLYRKVLMRQIQVPEWQELSLVITGNVAAYKSRGREFPGRVIEVDDAKIRLALAPEKVFLNALAASDLKLGEPTLIHKIKQNVLKFTHRNYLVTVYLNSFTNLPTAVETVSSSTNDFFWSIWGDVTTRTYYSYWMLEPGGIHYPRQWDIVRNDYLLESFSITDIKFDQAIDEKSFEITADTRKAFAAIKTPNVNEIPLGVPNRPESELVSGIFEIPGAWDIAFVRQADGIVILEAPISSGYSAKVILEAKKRFPNEKIKGIITTSDAFPHLGGIREYVAQKIPIYALDLNKSILEKIINSPRKMNPDNLERNSTNPNFKFVSNKTVIGKGENRLEIYPIRTESGERMMMVYFPAHKILYTSDLVQKLRNGSFFMPQYLSEIMHVVKRENLNVENIFGMHLSKTAWTEVLDTVMDQNKKAVEVEK